MKLSYIRSFDGIRAFFCLSIMVAHWKLSLPVVPFGWECLQIFFVLSGFLITRILLHERDKVDTFGKYIKVFYQKRAFRIFPLYFAYLGVWSIARVVFTGSEFIQTQTAELQYSGIWMYTYLYNFKTYFNFLLGLPFGDTPFFSHLWSLSVEEQFYLFFPFVIYFLRGKVLKTVVILLILVPFLSRFVGYPYLLTVNDDPSWAVLLIYRNIFFQYDSLAMGAALAIFNFDWIRYPKRWFYIVFGLIGALYIGNYWVVKPLFTHIEAIPFDIFLKDGQLNPLGYLHILGHPEILHYRWQFSYFIPLVNIACFLMVLCSIRDVPVGRRFFEHPVMVYLGKISYGMYVYHVAVQIFFLKAMRALLPAGMMNDNYLVHFLLFFVYVGVVIFVSHLSFQYFESIFLRLKSKIRV